MRETFIDICVHGAWQLTSWSSQDTLHRSEITLCDKLRLSLKTQPNVSKNDIIVDYKDDE